MRKRITASVSKPWSQADLLKNILAVTDTLGLHLIDSLYAKANLDSLPSSSLLPVGGLDSIPQTLRKIKEQTTFKIAMPFDTLKNEGDHTTKRIVSGKDSLEQSIVKAETAVRQKIERIPNTIQDKAENVVGKNLSAPGFPGTNVNLPDHALTGLEPATAIPEIPLPETQIPDITKEMSLDLSVDENLELPELNKVKSFDKELPDVGEIEEVNQIGGKANTITSQLDAAEKYEGELRQIKEGDLQSTEKLAEEKL